MIATPAEHEAALLRAAAEAELARIRRSVAEREHAARQAVLAAATAPAARCCPHCGQPIIIADTPAGADEWPPRSGWRERPSQI